MSSRVGPQVPRVRVMSWALYDWANSAFAACVMTAFFPIFFKRYWNAGIEPTEVTFRLGLASSLSSICIVVLAPILGAIADGGGRRKQLLAFFALIGVSTTGALSLVGEGQWVPALALYVAALLGFLGGNVFYDSLLVAVSDERSVDRVSALGFALGYVGGGVLLVVHGVFVIPNWESLGFVDVETAVKWCIGSVALWWALFSLPLFFFLPEPEATAQRAGVPLREAFVELAATFREVRALRVTFLFLVAYWLYIDGVDTVIVMAVDYGTSLGFSENDLIGALVLTQFVGAPAALAFGKLGERLGPQTGLYIGIVVYAGVCVGGYFVDEAWEFYALAVTIGLVQGGVQSLSRSLYTRLIPPSRAGQFFGFYNMLGKFAAVLGPMLVAVVAKLTGNPRLPILSLVLLFAAGFAVLRKVDLARGQAAALALDEESAGPPGG